MPAMHWTQAAASDFCGLSQAKALAWTLAASFPCNESLMATVAAIPAQHDGWEMTLKHKDTHTDHRLISSYTAWSIQMVSLTPHSHKRKVFGFTDYPDQEEQYFYLINLLILLTWQKKKIYKYHLLCLWYSMPDKMMLCTLQYIC